MSAFPEAPPNLKTIQPYLKIAIEHDQRDLVVAYWARIYSLQLGIKAAKQPDEKAFLLTLMDWLENVKKANRDNDSITTETVAQAYLENYAHKLFQYADQQDRASNFGKNVVKAFYTTSMLYDIITTFGELSEEAVQCRKYAKWKAAYIHNCLKNGETPQPGPMPTEGEDELQDEASGGGFTPGTSSSGGWNTNPYQQPYQPPPPTTQNYQPEVPTPAGNSGDPFNLPDPPKDPEPKHPGGFVPYNPSTSNIPAYMPQSTGSTSITPEQIAKAQKYCKYVSSALNYDDVPTAIDNLQKCLRLLHTGEDT
ncbi:CLUMA_CG019488, isoform A [Clunio marinus]|uniref:CLUMA_CG019488, isoform A n=1 Tax=Clunio marinus TaxID=568069 RepID=A0A1J1J3S8_9DIPT|nr:CLUMA_CG019488, isoform A [Clunio marinus]